MGTPSPRCTAEFKQKAIELYKKSGTTYAEVARGLGCDPGSLSDWVKRAKFEFIFLNESNWPVSEAYAALKVTRQGYYAWKSRPPGARHARRRIGRADIPGQVRGARRLRRAQGVHAAAGAGRPHVAKAGGPHHARAGPARRHARVRQKALGREAGLEARIGAGLGGAEIRGRRP